METKKRGGVPLYLWMLLGFAVGMGGGLYVNIMGLEVLPWVMDIIKSVGQIFLRLLFMLVLPLLFAALAVGVAEMGDLKSLGRVGFKTLVFTIIVSAIAVGIGLGMVNYFRPGDGVGEKDILLDLQEQIGSPTRSSFRRLWGLERG